MKQAISTAAVQLLLLVAVTTSVAPASGQAAMTGHGTVPRVIHQLRIYEIFDGNKKAFHDRFRDHAMWIMKRYNFRIVATWGRARTVGRTSSICSSGLISGQ